MNNDVITVYFVVVLFVILEPYYSVLELFHQSEFCISWELFLPVYCATNIHLLYHKRTVPLDRRSTLR